MERDRRGRGIHRKRSKRSNGVTRERIRKRKEDATLKGENTFLTQSHYERKLSLNIMILN